VLKRHGGLLALALAAFALVAARAATQSVVIDEADSYILFAAHPWKTVFWPSSGNHVLNTLLTVVSTHFFGVSAFTIRLPALAGAAIYIAAAFSFCVTLAESVLFELALFTCLVFNPFVLDYLVAARGYSLAIGFFLAAIAFLQSLKISRIALASLSLGLSFCANFSFAFADGLLMLVFLGWSVAHKRNRARLVAAGLLPGTLVTLLICGKTLLNWPAGQLYFGTESLFDTWTGLVSATFDAPNQRIAGRWLSSLYERYTSLPAALAIAVASGAAALFLLALDRRRREANRWTGFAALSLLALASTVLVHWIAFKTMHLLLPKNRTGLFLVVLFFVFFGAVVASWPRSGGSRIPRGVGIAILTFCAVYFLGCLRLSYFKEWRFNADSQEIYWRLVDLNRRCGIDRFSTEWRYVAALNFYRTSYSNGALHEFVGASANTPGEPAYVLYYWDSRNLIREQALSLAYYNGETNAAIAVRNCPVAPLSVAPP